jgi:hypothetical protein
MMIEKVILDYLLDKNIQGVQQNVYMETPKNEPDEYILIEKTGGPQDDGITHATIAVQSLSAKSMLRVVEINEAVKAAMADLPDNTNVYGCSLNTDYNYTNTSTRMYRYQAVFVVDY